MAELDLAISYVSGLLVPGPGDQGKLATVGPPRADGALNWEYGRAGKPRALGTAADRFDLFPEVFRFTTPSNTPDRVTTISVPVGYQASVRVASVADNGTIQRRQFVRWRGQRITIGAPTDLYGGAGFVDEEAAFGALAPGLVTRTLISTGVQIFVTGIAATTLHWTVEVSATLVQLYRP